jgi:hypothetical protein
MTTRTDFSEKMKKDGNSAPIADRSRNGSGMLPRSPRSIDGARATKKVLVIVNKKKISLEQVTLERELWNSALRTPPPYTPKTTYTRKSKNRFNPFRQEG